MKSALALFLIVHGLLNLMGFAKAFGLTELAQPMQPVSRPLGILWLVAALLTFITAGAFLFYPQLAGPLGLSALVVSQSLAFTAWSDMKFATAGNLILLLAALFVLLQKHHLLPLAAVG